MPFGRRRRPCSAEGATHARQVAVLPGAQGGLGLLSAEAIAPAAYWDSWADALPAINARLPSSAATYVRLLESEAGDGTHCLCRRRTLQDQGWSDCPTWRMLLEGARHAPPAAPGAGDWPHGWQYRGGPLPYTLAIACFCLPCRPVRAHCSAPRQVRMPERGLPLCRATRQPASRHKRCKLR